MTSVSEVIRNFAKTVKSHGGIIKSVLDLYRTDMLKYGVLVGTDRYGNRYFENKSFFLGRDRWVIYSDKVGLDYDASQIPPEWHGWIHHTYDEVPSKHTKELKWMKPHVENLSGTRGAYIPYDTTKPKIYSWKPGKKRQSSPET